MTSEWSRRASVIIIAYLAASGVAGISIMLVELRGHFPLTLQSLQITLSTGIKFGIFFVGIIAAIPAAIFIVLAERRRWRSLVLHIAFGGALAASSIWLITQGSLLLKTNLLGVALFAFHGATAGFTYWLIAGRNAGLRKTETP